MAEAVDPGGPLPLTSVPEVVGEDLHIGNGGWTFGGGTADVFGEHVRRSIPFYEVGHALVAELSDFFVRGDSVVYDIGTSLGELLERLADRHTSREDVRWIGIDSEPAMVEKARGRLEGRSNVAVELGNVVTHDFERADLIVAYYCLQFVAPKHRQDVLARIYESLNWGGGFLWFEKVRGEDARFQDMLNTAYIDFKLEQGYSPAEIVAKTRSLKGVLEPFSSRANHEMLERAGFVDVITVFRYLCFEGLLAIR